MITKDDVIHAAKLSKLRLQDGEVQGIASDLERVVTYVEQLMSVDVANVVPMLHPSEMSGPRRLDEATEVIGRRALEGFVGYEDGLVRVPKVVE